MAALSAAAMAQSVTTYSIYDVDQKGDLNVADVTQVVDKVVKNMAPAETPQYVTAEDLAVLLQGILDDLTLIKEKLNIADGNNPDTDDPYNGHEYVDLGVVVDGKSVYWATTNIGAELPADYGLYFAWGETVGYTENTNDGRKFDWVSYSSDLCGGTSHQMKKYCTDSDYGTVDDKTILDPDDDAAHVNWQGAWRMPTKKEQDALHDQCTWTWTTMTNSAGKSINGYKISNKNDSSKFIFLPSAGYRDDGNLSHAGSNGYYWSSTLNPSYSYYAYFLDFNSVSCSWNNDYRCYGRSVRPVCQ